MESIMLKKQLLTAGLCIGLFSLVANIQTQAAGPKSPLITEALVQSASLNPPTLFVSMAANMNEENMTDLFTQVFKGLTSEAAEKIRASVFKTTKAASITDEQKDLIGKCCMAAYSKRLNELGIVTIGTNSVWGNVRGL
jgi:hypothetical protein